MYSWAKKTLAARHPAGLRPADVMNWRTMNLDREFVPRNRVGSWEVQYHVRSGSTTYAPEGMTNDGFKKEFQYFMGKLQNHAFFRHFTIYSTMTYYILILHFNITMSRIFKCSIYNRKPVGPSSQILGFRSLARSSNKT
jgi:hypothetical protein